MGNVGVIAEYNPFHNGHAYHLERARAEAGGGRVIVAMSGDFVQRGEVAMLPKAMRVRHALAGGADMVLQLPTAFSLASAQRFARAGVDLLAAAGIVDALCFGSECGDMTALKRAAEYEPDGAAAAALADNLSRGLSYPDALCRASSGAIPAAPNDTLGMEYLRALRAHPHMLPYCIKRTAPHDGEISASAIRSAASNTDFDTVRALVPDCVYADILAAYECGAAPRTNKALALPLLYALRRMSASDIAALPDVSEGLENVILRAALSAADYDGLLALIKSRRYTMSRIKRILMCALLGIDSSVQAQQPAQYIRVLGVRRDALGLLSGLSERAGLPVITRYCDTAALNQAARRLHDIDLTAADIAALASPIPSPAGFDYGSPLIIV